MEVQIINISGRKIRIAPIRKAVRKLLEKEGVKGKEEISIALVDIPTMRDLQIKYKGTDSLTDVLAFPMDGAILGDVVVCVDVAEEQGKEYGTGFISEISILVLHGILHLLGYDDSTEEGKELMLRKAMEVVEEVTRDEKKRTS